MGCKGDFGPWNTLASPEEVTVIVFFGYREDPLSCRYSQYARYMETQLNWPVNSPARVRHVRDSFLAGLGPVPNVLQPLPCCVSAAAISADCRSRPQFGHWQRFMSVRTNVAWFLSATSALWAR